MKKAKSLINVLEHSLVPPMEIVPEGKRGALLEKYSLSSPLQLPHMKKNDPATVALGAKEGDIVKIDRQEPTGKCTYYRVVVA